MACTVSAFVVVQALVSADRCCKQLLIPTEIDRDSWASKVDSRCGGSPVCAIPPICAAAAQTAFHLQLAGTVASRTRCPNSWSGNGRAAPAMAGGSHSLISVPGCCGCFRKLTQQAAGVNQRRWFGFCISLNVGHGARHGARSRPAAWRPAFHQNGTYELLQVSTGG